MLSRSSILQSEQLPSRVPSETSPSQSSPASLLPPPAYEVCLDRGYALPACTSSLRRSLRTWGGGIMLVMKRDHLPGSLGVRKEKCGYAREDEHIGGSHRRDG